MSRTFARVVGATEQDIEDACEYMDRRERDTFEELGEVAACDDDEHALMLQAPLYRVDDGW